jgi:Tol biopolymer transport system component
MRWTVWITLLLALLPVACTEYPKYVSFSTVDCDPDWSPDGRFIAFASTREDGSTGIYVVRPDGRGLRRLFSGTASQVDWSPDGRRIAFVGVDGIYVMRSDGRRRPMRILRGREFSLPAWTPDGHTLAVVKDERDLTTAIYVVRLDGGGLRRLLPPLLARSDPRWSIVAASETEPAWSPDGRQIAFDSGHGRLVAVRIAEGNRRQIASEGFSPAWSPNGRLIAFQCGSAGALCVANADGSGDIRQLTSEGGDPSWAPGSRRVVFDVYHSRGHFRPQARSLSFVDVTGGGLREVTYGPSPPANP